MPHREGALNDDIAKFNGIGLSEDKHIEVGMSSDYAMIERATKLEEYNSKRQDRMQRGAFASRIFRLLCWYMGAVALLIILNGFSVFGFNLSDSVAITLLGTATANVISIFVIVAKYLFPARNAV